MFSSYNYHLILQEKIFLMSIIFNIFEGFNPIKCITRGLIFFSGRTIIIKGLSTVFNNSWNNNFNPRYFWGFKPPLFLVVSSSPVISNSFELLSIVLFFILLITFIKLLNKS